MNIRTQENMSGSPEDGSKTKDTEIVELGEIEDIASPTSSWDLESEPDEDMGDETNPDWDEEDKLVEEECARIAKAHAIQRCAEEERLRKQKEQTAKQRAATGRMVSELKLGEFEWLAPLLKGGKKAKTDEVFTTMPIALAKNVEGVLEHTRRVIEKREEEFHLAISELAYTEGAGEEVATEQKHTAALHKKLREVWKIGKKDGAVVLDAAHQWSDSLSGFTLVKPKSKPVAPEKPVVMGARSVATPPAPQSTESNKCDTCCSSGFDIMQRRAAAAAADPHQLACTRVCESVRKGQTTCRHGVNCRFAHALTGRNALAPKECGFENCLKMYKTEACGRVCECKHLVQDQESGETRWETVEEVLERMGVTLPEVWEPTPKPAGKTVGAVSAKMSAAERKERTDIHRQQKDAMNSKPPQQQLPPPETKDMGLPAAAVWPKMATAGSVEQSKRALTPKSEACSTGSDSVVVQCTAQQMIQMMKMMQEQGITTPVKYEIV